MTVINVIASLIYASKQSLKDKLQLIGMALIFLILLYGSPSGLVFYWTINNLFSLVKNIVSLIRKPAPSESAKSSRSDKLTNTVFMLSCGAIAALSGLMIPANVISQNPAELINSYGTELHSPIVYLISSALIAIGIFSHLDPVVLLSS